MKKPQKPPDSIKFLKDNKELIFKIIDKTGLTDSKGRYLHWDKIRHLKPPEGLTNEEWWAGIKLKRTNLYNELFLKDEHGHPFKFCVTDTIHQDLHWLDMNAAGTISTNKPVANSNMRSTYLIKSLVEEAINSSQLEGATTTRKVAKEMMRQGRSPKDKSEQMILNNYHAMEFIRDYKYEHLTPSIILELHKIVTEGTLDDQSKAGVLRVKEDNICVVDSSSFDTLHYPPDASCLEKRLEQLCAFANGASDAGFIHPVIRAVTLHFMLSY
ncbi:MAG TPA: Fic family protein, partial [Desulfobacterales bacterium]|nr:Fic family protein [Desulfobacterales bacterium]